MYICASGYTFTSHTLPNCESAVIDFRYIGFFKFGSLTTLTRADKLSAYRSCFNERFSRDAPWLVTPNKT